MLLLYKDTGVISDSSLAALSMGVQGSMKSIISSEVQVSALNSPMLYTAALPVQ